MNEWEQIFISLSPSKETKIGLAFDSFAAPKETEVQRRFPQEGGRNCQRCIQKKGPIKVMSIYMKYRYRRLGIALNKPYLTILSLLLAKNTRAKFGPKIVLWDNIWSQQHN